MFQLEMTNHSSCYLSGQYEGMFSVTTTNKELDTDMTTSGLKTVGIKMLFRGIKPGWIATIFG